MKKSLVIMIIICSLLLIIKYRFSNYNISYKIDNYNITTVYNNKRFYYEIDDGVNKYNFDIYSNRKFNKTVINDIKVINGDNFNCIYPIIKDERTYPLCYLNGEFTDFNLIESDLLSSYKNNNIDTKKSNKDFNYYNALSSNEYVALWNYKGYIVMNGDNYQNVELFNNDKYDNSLSFMIGNNIYMANNDENHEFTKFIKLNVESLKKEIIDIGYTIDFDSYIVGSVKNNIYLFDNKYSVLYEIDTKKNKVIIIGNNDKGFVKYQDDNFISCSKTEYIVNKIKYNDNSSNYSYSDDGIYKVINDNKTIIEKINNNNVNLVSEYKNILYYQLNDIFYKYDPVNGSRIIFDSYELNFNKDNTIFVYNK